MYDKKQQNSPRVEFSYQRQRHDGGELVVPERRKIRGKLSAGQINKIETEFLKAFKIEKNRELANS